MSEGPIPMRRVASETALERIRRLENEARQESKKVVDDLLAALSQSTVDCAAVSELASVLPGVQDELRQIGIQISNRLDTINAIRNRAQ